MPPPAKDTLKTKKVDVAQRSRIARIMGPTNNDRNLQSPRQGRSLFMSPVTGLKKKPTNSKTILKTISKRAQSHCGFVTLLDVSMINQSASLASKVHPQKEFVPNSYHQEFHLARLRKWLNKAPKWFQDFGQECLRGQRSPNDSFSSQKEGNEENNINSHNVESSMKNKKDVEEREMEGGKTESVNQQNKTKGSTREWKDWSLQLTNNGRLLITGKADQTLLQQSSDVSLCTRLDANTLVHSDGSMCLLVGMPDHFTNLPYYVRNRFQCGFPEDWKTVQFKWMEYLKRGSPFDYAWKNVADITISEDSILQNTRCHSQTFVVPITPPLGRQSEVDGNSRTTLGSVKSLSSARRYELFKLQEKDNSIKMYGSRKMGQLKRIHSTPVQKHFKRPRSKVIQEHNKQSNGKDAVNKPDAAKVHNDSSSGASLSSSFKEPSPPIRKSPRLSDDDIGSQTNGLLNRNVSLHRWIPVLVNGCDLKIMGYVKSSRQSELFHTSDVMEIRKSNYSFRSKDGTTYKLMGSFADPNNSLPSEVQRKLMNGLPTHWKMMVKNWASLVSSTK